MLKPQRCAVAITGSVARGNAGPGSDLDLWVLGRVSAREHLRFRGVPVTLLRQRPRQALSFDSLCLFEVVDLVVLTDPRGQFARVQREARRRRSQVRRAIVEATWADLEGELGRARAGSTWSQVIWLRAAAFRLSSLWVYERTGWRVPRYRTLQAHLPRLARRTLRGLLGLPVARPAAVFAGLPITARRVWRSLQASVQAGALDWAERPQVPREVDQRLAAGELDEAVLLLRRELVQAWLPPLLRARGAHDVANLALADGPKGVRALVVRAFGLERTPPWSAPHARAAREAFGRLARELGYGRAARLV